MTTHFTPCIGRTACRDDGERCLACQRTLTEIERSRAAIEVVTTFLEEMRYENPEQFLEHLSSKVLKKLKARASNSR